MISFVRKQICKLIFYLPKIFVAFLIVKLFAQSSWSSKPTQEIPKTSDLT